MRSDDLWEPAERGPYPLFHADARNLLAELERDAGHTAAAVAAARRGYELAWCDGPPFAYHWGLVKARALLAELGAEEPVLVPFDASKFEPMPEVEIDPPDDPVESKARRPNPSPPWPPSPSPPSAPSRGEGGKK